MILAFALNTNLYLLSECAEVETKEEALELVSSLLTERGVYVDQISVASLSSEPEQTEFAISVEEFLEENLLHKVFNV